MILTCPNCTTRFLLSAFVLAPDGRKVKCSNCGESWFQLPDPEELNAAPEEKPQDIPESVKPIPKGSSVPAVKEDDDESGKSNIKGAVLAAIFFVMLSAVFIFGNKTITQIAPSTLSVYSSLGVVSTLPGQGLVFDQLKAVAKNDSNANEIHLSGSIINLTTTEVSIPVMVAELRDEEGQPVRRIVIEPPATTLASERTMPFEAFFDDNANVKEVFLQFSLTKPK